MADQPESAAVKLPPMPAIEPAEIEESVQARAAVRETSASMGAGVVIDEEAPTNWPDETAESAFLADARNRGEAGSPAPAKIIEPSEEPDNQPLPSLDELVKRIPAEVRETLDDLFRARFVTVKRVPKRALKSSPGGAA